MWEITINNMLVFNMSKQKCSAKEEKEKSSSIAWPTKSAGEQRFGKAIYSTRRKEQVVTVRH